MYMKSTSRATPVRTRSQRLITVPPAFQQTGCYGGSCMTYNNKPIDYIFWDDPNERCERLKLLMANKIAENSSHDNEMLSRLSELKEEGIILDHW